MNKLRILRLFAFLYLFAFSVSSSEAQATEQPAPQAPTPPTWDGIAPQEPLDAIVADPTKTITFKAMGVYSDGKNRPIESGLLEWTSSSSDVLEFLPNSSIAIPKKAGVVTISVADVATHGRISTLVIHVLAPTPDKIVSLALPPAITVTIGTPLVLTAEGATEGTIDKPVNYTKLTPDQIKSWTPQDKTIATVDSNGTITGLLPKSTSVTLVSTILKDGQPLTATTIVTVVNPPAVQPRIGSKLIAGSKTVTVLANGGDTISIYQFDPGFNPGTECSKDLSRATLLSIVINPTTNKPTFTLPVGAPPDPPYSPQTLTLALPLIAGTGLCILDRPVSAPASAAWSSLQFVPDPDDYGRVRTYFIAGVQVSNQQAASASSTAGQYLEAGFNYAWIRAKDRSDYFHPRHFSRTPGLSTILDTRLSPIPVAAPATMTTVTTTPGTMQPAMVSSTPNMLTTQQSARVVGSIYFPFKTTHFNKRSDYFTFAPVLRGGFATLLNPTIGSVTTSTGTTSVLTTTTGAFNSSYSFVGYGARLGWDRYPASTDEAPQPIAQFLVTLGSYSNLPSYECKTSTTLTTSNLTGSACGLSTGPFASKPFASRTLVPRLDIDGFIKLPNYPYVLGLDANLAQYSVFNRSDIDYLSKPGNDIRIYVGFKLDIGTIVSKLGLGSQ